MVNRGLSFDLAQLRLAGFLHHDVASTQSGS